MLHRALFLALICTVPALRAIEPWADATLPVKDGLTLWLDADREAKARAAERRVRPEVVRDGPAVVPALDGTIWHDASGLGRHLRPTSEATQPTFRTYWPVSGYGFDNAKRTSLTLPGPAWSSAAVTIFVAGRVIARPGAHAPLLTAPGLSLDLGTRAELGPKFFATLISAPGDAGQKVFLNGVPLSSANRAAGSTLALTPLTVGADSAANQFLNGDIFEIIAYDRVLDDAERKSTDAYLAAKYAGYIYVAPAKAQDVAGSVPLAPVDNPPTVQPLVPGFTARQLPVKLTNVNALRYRADGRLYAGAYDGKIYLLTDTDGDGLEDKVDLFWSSPDLNLILAIAPTPPGYARGEGLFVIARGRILLILDKDHDGRGDEVITVASGWTPPQVMGGGLADAMGLAIAPDGRVFFSLGTSAFTNPYLLHPKTGEPGYRVTGERGTIQEVSADFTKRTTVATGIRFAFGMAFNRHSDLFATEQEGATWLPNGNPFDELLHIQPGRHYGFPPRHPKFLPDVTDEPSTFDYGPQHQCTCGLYFNEPHAAHGPIFGPAWWTDDAFIAGESRGNIFRTKLVKTTAGYVAKNETIAIMKGLAIDLTTTPRGALVMSMHSGRPDWGTGPTGAGELWQLTPTAAPAPQPVTTWSASPTELRVAFDRALPAEFPATVAGKVTVTTGRYVEAGDRFISVRPGYQIVKNQLAAARFPVAVEKLALADAGHTLVLTTAPRTAATPAAVTVAANAFSAPAAPYAGQLDLLADLNGVETAWQPAGSDAAPTKSWLPHLDFTVARELTAPAAAFAPFWSQLTQPGTLTLRGQLDLGDMLQPIVQPGSKLDWEYSAESVTVVLNAATPFSATLGKTTVASTPTGDRHEIRHAFTTKAGTWLPFSVALPTGTADPAFTATWFTARSATPRPFPLRRLLLPYARPAANAASAHANDHPALAGGDWQNGKALYYGAATCFICHAVRGEGANFGPDLTNLAFRDYESVLRDIREPNATINPEHVGYTVTRKDGTEATGVLAAETATAVTLTLPASQSLVIPRAEIATMKQLPTSLMPAGLDQNLSAAQLRDLMTFLLTAPPAGQQP